MLTHRRRGQEGAFEVVGEVTGAVAKIVVEDGGVGRGHETGGVRSAVLRNG